MLKFRDSSAQYLNRENLTVSVGFSHFATYEPEAARQPQKIGIYVCSPTLQNYR